MNKLVLAAMILGEAAAGLQTAKAGDGEWAVVGKVLTGVAVASAINHAVVTQPAPAPCSCSCSFSIPSCGYRCCLPPPPQRVVCVQPAPRPVVVYRAPVCVAPAPVCIALPALSVRVGFGAGHRHHFRHGCR